MKWNKSIAITCVLLVCLGVIARIVTRSEGGVKATYSQFVEKVRAGEVASVVISASKSGANPATYHLTDGRAERTVLPGNYKDVIAAMQEKRVNVEIRDPSSEWFSRLMNSAPFLLLLGFWLIMMRKVRNWSWLGNAG